MENRTQRGTAGAACVTAPCKLAGESESASDQNDYETSGFFPFMLIVSSLFRHPICISEKAVAPHSSTLAWKIHGWRSLVGYSPWGHTELDTTG